MCHIKNTYPFIPDNNPDWGIVTVAGAASSKVGGSRPSMLRAPFGAMHTSSNSVHHCLPESDRARGG